MQLRELISDVTDELRGDVDAAVEIRDLTEDSRTVAPGSLFIARGGTAAHGNRFIGEAVARGAVAILTDHDSVVPQGIPVIRSPLVARTSAHIAERFFGSPASALMLLGITGTNGKTTVAHLTQQLLNHAGARCGLLGTVLVDDGAMRAPATLTTPGAIEISRSLARMRDHGCTHAVMEVSSHALQQGRVSALTFAVAVFTNLSGDHLDYHGSMEAYAAAKALLFESLGHDAIAVVNADDASAARMTARCGGRVIRCSAKNDGADAFIRASNLSVAGADVVITGPFGRVDGRTTLLGAHNLMNLLQAVTAAHAMGADIQSIAAHIEALQAPPGRLEPVRLADGAPQPTVLVDYAHTDDALANALRAVRPLVADRARLWVIFGCGGDRDATKRPRMGAVAAQLADCVVVTSDNPRREDPHRIIDEIVAGIGDIGADALVVEADRAAAIEHAIRHAFEDDVIVIAGKGHEDYQIVSDGAGGVVRRDFDDRIQARRALEHRSRMVTS